MYVELLFAAAQVLLLSPMTHWDFFLYLGAGWSGYKLGGSCASGTNLSNGDLVEEWASACSSTTVS
jgi:hypothetical protein